MDAQPGGSAFHAGELPGLAGDQPIHGQAAYFLLEGVQLLQG